TGDRLADRRRGQGGVRGIDAGAVAAQDVEPAVRTALDVMGVVFAAGPEGADQLRRAVGAIVAVVVAVAAEAAGARHEERIAFPQNPLRPVGRPRGEVNGTIGPTVVVVIDQDANVAPARDDDASPGIDRQTVDVVG